MSELGSRIRNCLFTKGAAGGEVVAKKVVQTKKRVLIISRRFISLLYNDKRPFILLLFPLLGLFQCFRGERLGFGQLFRETKQVPIPGNSKTVKRKPRHWETG